MNRQFLSILALLFLFCFGTTGQAQTLPPDTGGGTASDDVPLPPEADELPEAEVEVLEFTGFHSFDFPLNIDPWDADPSPWEEEALMNFLDAKFLIAKNNAMVLFDLWMAIENIKVALGQADPYIATIVPKHPLSTGGYYHRIECQMLGLPHDPTKEWTAYHFLTVHITRIPAE